MSPSAPAPGILEIHEAPDPALYGRLLRDAQRSRCCPVLLGFRATDGAGGAGGVPVPPDPWAAVGSVDPHGVLRGWWPGPCDDGCPCLEPFEAGFPPRPVTGPDRSREVATSEAAEEYARAVAPYSDLAVVEAERPADVPLAIRWAGMGSYPDHDLVGLTAVLRSWEERFGAVVVRLGMGTLALTVAHPPRTTAEAEALAAEHVALCPDQQDPHTGAVHTPRSCAVTIRGACAWRFRWD